MADRQGWLARLSIPPRRSPPSRPGHGRRWLAALLLLGGVGLALTGSPHPLRAQGSQDIVEIVIEGTEQVEKGLILSTLLSRVGERLDANKVTKDIKSLFALGYFQDVRAYAEEVPGKGLRLVLVVMEKPRIAFVRLEGVTILSKSTLDKVNIVKAGSVYNPVEVDKTVEALRKSYREKGYFSIKISSRIDRISEKSYGLYLIVEETPRVYVTDIATHNNRVFSELEIRRMMQTAEVDCFDWINQSGVLDEAMINQDLQVVTARYLTLGYIRLFIEKPKVTIVHNPDFSRVKVELTFREGAQYFTGKVDIAGDILGDKDTLMALLLLKEGNVYNPFNQNKDVFNLSERYQEQGYAFARVTPDTRIDDERHIVDVTYRITKGEKAYIGRIEVQGNRETRDYVIRREFEVREDELYNGRKLRQTQSNLRALGYFTPSLALDTQPTEVDNILDVVTKVEETQTGTFQAQIGYSEQTQLTASVSLSKGNLFGRGQTLRIQAEGGQRGVRQNYSVDFIEPHLADSNFSSDSSAAYRNLQDLTELNRGNFKELRLSQGFGYPFFRLFQFGLTFEATNREFSRSRNPDVILRSVTPSLTYNTVNHPIFPSDGTKATISASQVGGRALGGTTEYRRYRLLWQRFSSLNEADTVILMGRMRLSWLEQVGNNVIPGEDRFRLGGISTLRGYNYLEVGGPYGALERDLNSHEEPVLDDNGDPVLDEKGAPITAKVDVRTRGLSEAQLAELAGGGISERLFNVELLFPLTGENIRGLIFYDAGNVSAERRQYELLGENEPPFFHLLQSVGTGIRLITPLGVFRFEYGYKLTRSRRETPDKFDFTISTLF